MRFLKNKVWLPTKMNNYLFSHFLAKISYGIKQWFRSLPIFLAPFCIKQSCLITIILHRIYISKYMPEVFVLTSYNFMISLEIPLIYSYVLTQHFFHLIIVVIIETLLHPITITSKILSYMLHICVFLNIYLPLC